MRAHLKGFGNNDGPLVWMDYMSWDSMLSYAKYKKNESTMRDMQVHR